jgi:tellurite resistance protein
MNFVPAISIGILLLATAWGRMAPEVASWMWGLGAALHLAFTLRTMSAWIHHTHFEIQHLNPAWFIPVVGNIIVPLAGVRFAPAEVSWFFFSIGLVFWIVLFAIVMYRLFFHAPLALRLTPTLFILLAPPSVGFVAYTGLSGGLDAFGRVLYYTALFLGLLFASNALRFFRVPFFVSAWAYSFPLAALTVATLTMAELSGLPAFRLLGAALVLTTSGVIALLGRSRSVLRCAARSAAPSRGVDAWRARIPSLKGVGKGDAAATHERRVTYALQAHTIPHNS